MIDLKDLIKLSPINGWYHDESFICTKNSKFQSWQLEYSKSHPLRSQAISKASLTV